MILVLDILDYWKRSTVYLTSAHFGKPSVVFLILNFGLNVIQLDWISLQNCQLKSEIVNNIKFRLGFV